MARSRAEASQELLAKLNGAVQVHVYTGDITEDLLRNFQVPSQPLSPCQPSPLLQPMGAEQAGQWLWPC